MNSPYRLIAARHLLQAAACADPDAHDVHALLGIGYALLALQDDERADNMTAEQEAATEWGPA